MTARYGQARDGAVHQCQISFVMVILASAICKQHMCNIIFLLHVYKQIINVTLANKLTTCVLARKDYSINVVAIF